MTLFLIAYIIIIALGWMLASCILLPVEGGADIMATLLIGAFWPVALVAIVLLHIAGGPQK